MALVSQSLPIPAATVGAAMAVTACDDKPAEQPVGFAPAMPMPTPDAAAPVASDAAAPVATDTPPPDVSEHRVGTISGPEHRVGKRAAPEQDAGKP